MTFFAKRFYRKLFHTCLLYLCIHSKERRKVHNGEHNYQYFIDSNSVGIPDREISVIDMCRDKRRIPNSSFLDVIFFFNLATVIGRTEMFKNIR